MDDVANLIQYIQGFIPEKSEKKTGGVFAGLSVSFNDFTEAWMDEDLVEIEKPELVKKVEKYLKKVTQGYRNNNPEEEELQNTPHLTEWTKEGDFHE